MEHKERGSLSGDRRRRKEKDRPVPETAVFTGKEKLSCPVLNQCGGCQYLAVPYPQQLENKRQRVQKLLKPFCRVRPVQGMEEPLHYRNKVHAVFSRNTRGDIICGMYEEETHHVVQTEHCLIEDKRADRIIADIRKLAASFRMEIYHEDLRRGFLRHVLIRTGHASGQILVVLVTGTAVFPSKQHFIKALMKLHPEITSIVQNVNARQTSMILGDRDLVLQGPGYIEDDLCGVRFRISPHSFYQVNSVQAEKLFHKAVELAELTGKERVVDAYCGIGTIGLIAARRAGEVIGVESNGQAVRDAIWNAKKNGLRNVRFFEGDAGEFLTGMARERERADVVFMDPPRTGSSEAFMKSVTRMAPERIVYISCNPLTLARDLRYLTQNGYKAEEAWPYDLFPQTEHVETVCCLYHQKKEFISVPYEPKNADYLKRIPGSATYGEIKEWIQKHYNGMKVSNLYIAQINDKHGLDKRENYNISKNPEAKVPVCPPEKEQAIEAALRHFRMIE